MSFKGDIFFQIVYDIAFKTSGVYICLCLNIFTFSVKVQWCGGSHAAHKILVFLFFHCNRQKYFTDL